MDISVLERRFAAIGARVKVANEPWRGSPEIDVLSDRLGEYFDVRFRGNGPAIELAVVDVQPADRHLLFLVRRGAEKSKFCAVTTSGTGSLPPFPRALGVWPEFRPRSGRFSRRRSTRRSVARGRKTRSGVATARMCGRESGSSCPSRDSTST
jgi:hypothetical protein